MRINKNTFELNKATIDFDFVDLEFCKELKKIIKEEIKKVIMKQVNSQSTMLKTHVHFNKFL